MVTRVNVASRVYRDLKDHRDTQVPQVIQALEAILVNLGFKVKPVLPGVALVD